MNRILPVLALLLVGPIIRGASVTVGPWSPIFQGVEFASGAQRSQGTSAPDQQVRCLRVDLSAPGIELFATPKCADCALDTLSENTVVLPVDSVMEIPGETAIGLFDPHAGQMAD